MTDQPRILWVTNLAAPYRLPVWEELGRSYRLQVGLLEPNRRLRADSDQNRGSDWLARPGKNFDLREYRTLRVRRGAERHYGLWLPDAATDLARSRAVLLSGWDSPAYWQLLAQAKATGRATVGFYESILASQSRSQGRLAQARSRFFRSLDRVVVPGPSAGEAVRAMGVEPHRVLTGFNAVDVAAFAHADWRPSEAGHRFLYIGQLVQRKNVEAILDSFAAIATAADSLTLVGKGPLRAQLGARAEALGVAGRVEFIEFVPNRDLPGLMARHDTLVLASHVEVWGLVVNEALAAGLQAVVTSNCGVAASVEAMPGVHLAAGDAADLADVMRRARDGFTGRVGDPPILEQTPERFAGVFSLAFAAAMEDHGRRPAGTIRKDGAA